MLMWAWHGRGKHSRESTRRSQRGKAAAKKRYKVCARLRQGSCGEEDNAMRWGKLWRRRDDGSFVWEVNQWRRRDDGSHGGGGDPSGGEQIGLINFFGNEHYCLRRFLNISHDKSKVELLLLLPCLERIFVWDPGD